MFTGLKDLRDFVRRDALKRVPTAANRKLQTANP